MTGSATTPIAISMGEPQGVGPDLILSLFARRDELGLPPFVVFGEHSLLQARAVRLGLDVSIAQIDIDACTCDTGDALPVVDCGAPIADRPGEPDAAHGGTVITAISEAVEMVRRGQCRALVTAPIHKAILYDAGFAHPGHTEFLASLCSEGEDGPARLPVMMLAHEGYRVVPLTIHIPLASVAQAITPSLLAATVRVVAMDLRSRFGIAEPRLAISGLNPHAGEEGQMGREEVDVITPTIATLQADGFDVHGPLSADTLFHPPHWEAYDCVIAMYHDQALIPIKTLAFDSGVNVTLGLPIVRTSPDHGTAFGLAGTGKASVSSMLAALRMADEMSRSTA